MNRGVGHFVRRILGIHLLLLALLLTVVSMAARHVYESARIKAMQQARAQQTLIVTPMARGVTGFYGSILSDLSLLKPFDDEESDLPDVSQSAVDARPLQSIGAFRQALSGPLVRQLAGRAVLYLVEDQGQTLTPRLLGTDDRPARLFNHNGKFTTQASAPQTLAEQEAIKELAPWIVKEFGPWLKTLKEGDISGLRVFHDEKGVDKAIKLISIPLITAAKPPLNGKAGNPPRRAGWLVAAVSARPIERNFFNELNQNGVSGAYLVDESMNIMACSDHGLVGTHLDSDTAPELVKLLADLRTAAAANAADSHASSASTGLVNGRFWIKDQRFAAAMVSVSPVTVLGKPWFVLVTSPLQDVDQVVRDLSSKALFWAIFVAISMTAILVSTAAQLIFSRMKMERLRHQSLQNEMRQARQIQLAWLPQKTKTMCGSSLIDIASLNRPATHISGDFYNFFELPDGRTAVAIGDVTGHGTAAAFLMATTQLLVRNTLPQLCDPGRCLEEVNKQLTNQVVNGQFVTMQVLVIDSRNGEVAIATAGHPAPLVSDGESFNSLRIESQLVAGIDPKTQYPTERFRIRPGASILLFTDGVIEAQNPAGDRLRLDGLRKALTGKVESAEILLQRAVSAVHTFRHGVDLQDDLTMVAIHLFPAPKPLPHAPVMTNAPMKALPTARV